MTMRAIWLLPTLALVAGLVAACPAGSSSTAGTTASGTSPPPPAVKLRSFDGHRGVIRIKNRSRKILRRVAIGIRAFGCEGPKATRTEVKVFDLRLKPGERQSFAFRFEHRCKKARVAVAAQ